MKRRIFIQTSCLSALFNSQTIFSQTEQALSPKTFRNTQKNTNFFYDTESPGDILTKNPDENFQISLRHGLLSHNDEYFQYNENSILLFLDSPSQKQSMGLLASFKDEGKSLRGNESSLGFDVLDFLKFGFVQWNEETKQLELCATLFQESPVLHQGNSLQHFSLSYRRIVGLFVPENSKFSFVLVIHDFQKEEIFFLGRDRKNDFWNILPWKKENCDVSLNFYSLITCEENTANTNQGVKVKIHNYGQGITYFSCILSEDKIVNVKLLGNLKPGHCLHSQWIFQDDPIFLKGQKHTKVPQRDVEITQYYDLNFGKLSLFQTVNQQLKTIHWVQNSDETFTAKAIHTKSFTVTSNFQLILLNTAGTQHQLLLGYEPDSGFFIIETHWVESKVEHVFIQKNLELLNAHPIIQKYLVNQFHGDNLPILAVLSTTDHFDWERENHFTKKNIKPEFQYKISLKDPFKVSEDMSQKLNTFIIKTDKNGMLQDVEYRLQPTQFYILNDPLLSSKPEEGKEDDDNDDKATVIISIITVVVCIFYNAVTSVLRFKRQRELEEYSLEVHSKNLQQMSFIPASAISSAKDHISKFSDGQKFDLEQHVFCHLAKNYLTMVQSMTAVLEEQLWSNLEERENLFANGRPIYDYESRYLVTTFKPLIDNIFKPKFTAIRALSLLSISQCDEAISIFNMTFFLLSEYYYTAEASFPDYFTEEFHKNFSNIADKIPLKFKRLTRPFSGMIPVVLTYGLFNTNIPAHIRIQDFMTLEKPLRTNILLKLKNWFQLEDDTYYSSFRLNPIIKKMKQEYQEWIYSIQQNQKLQRFHNHILPFPFHRTNTPESIRIFCCVFSLCHTKNTELKINLNLSFTDDSLPFPLSIRSRKFSTLILPSKLFDYDVQFADRFGTQVTKKWDVTDVRNFLALSKLEEQNRKKEITFQFGTKVDENTLLDCYGILP